MPKMNILAFIVIFLKYWWNLKILWIIILLSM